MVLWVWFTSRKYFHFAQCQRCVEDGNIHVYISGKKRSPSTSEHVGATCWWNSAVLSTSGEVRFFQRHRSRRGKWFVANDWVCMHLKLKIDDENYKTQRPDSRDVIYVCTYIYVYIYITFVVLTNDWWCDMWKIEVSFHTSYLLLIFIVKIEITLMRRSISLLTNIPVCFIHISYLDLFP